MPSGVRHSFVSAKADGGDATLVRPTDWNAEHQIKAFHLDSDISPTQITANQNDYSPTGLADASVLRLSTDQPRAITGIAGGADGRILTLLNISAGAGEDVILRDENTGSSAANRFSIGFDIVIEPGEAITIIYDATSSRWRPFSTRRYTGGTFRRNPFFIADFLGAAGAATVEATWPWDVSLISSGTQAKVAGLANHPGILRITSSTTGNSGAFVRTAVDALLLGGGEIAEFVFRINTLTNLTFRLGFLDTSTVSDAVDGAYIEVPASGAAVGKTSNNSTRTTSATIVTLATATWYIARIVVRKDLSGVDFYIFDDNGNLLGSQSNTTNIPTAAGRETGHGYVVTNGGTVATSLIDMDYMSLEFTRALV